MKIFTTKDHNLIAALNEEVQNLHAHLLPEIFKPFDKAETEKALADFLSDPDCHCYVVQKDETYIGYAVFFIKEAKENAFHYLIRTLYIDQICILNEYQKSGAGKLLMEQAEKLARENSIPKIELDHWSTNIIAAEYFRKKGYRLYRERLFKIVE